MWWQVRMGLQWIQLFAQSCSVKAQKGAAVPECMFFSWDQEWGQSWTNVYIMHILLCFTERFVNVTSLGGFFTAWMPSKCRQRVKERRKGIQLFQNSQLVFLANKSCQFTLTFISPYHQVCLWLSFTWVYIFVIVCRCCICSCVFGCWLEMLLHCTVSRIF